MRFRKLVLVTAFLAALGGRESAAEQQFSNRQTEVAQRLLKLLGYDPGPPNNIEGGATGKAILAFEQDHRLDLVGRVTDDLLKALRMEAWQRKVVQKRLGGRRSIGAAEVREAQQILQDLGFQPGPTDGHYGGQTMAAVMAFQKSGQQEEDGVLDGRLLAALRQTQQGMESIPRDRTVVFYNWADYIHPGFPAEARRDTGVAVKMEVFDSVGALEETLRRGIADHDIVVPTASMMVRSVQDGIYRRIDAADLNNLPNLNQEIVEKIPSPLKIVTPGTGKVTGLYGIPYMVGTTGFGIDIDAVAKRVPDAPLDSTSILFDPAIVRKLADCGVRVVNDPDDMASMALIHIAARDGRPVKEVLENPSLADIGKVAGLFKEIQPYVRADDVTAIRKDLEEGRACLALAYSGDVLQARQTDKRRIVYRTPRNGSLLWIDMLAIPTHAANVRGAVTILDYLLRPKVIAAASNHTRYANANSEASKSGGMEVELVKDIARLTPLTNSYAVGERRPEIAEAIRNAWDASLGAAR